MTKQTLKGRFAPSPTGRMHLGNAFSALLSYLSIKSKGGKWVLRIEDLDRSRCKYEYARQLEEDLQWLGLEWDEGGADNTDYCQSSRSGIYEHYFNLLNNTGLVYPCFCTRADINAAGAPHQSDGRVIYSGKCRPERLGGNFKNLGNQPRKPSWRICVPDRDESIDDLHYGPVGINLARNCGDFIIRRSDGTAAYQLAVVVDDALMGISEVVRGRDLLLSAPQQQWLHNLLGFTPPQFGHLPLLCAQDGRRLCKRDRDMDFGELRKRYSAEELIGILGHIAGLTDTDEPTTARELIKKFSWDRIPAEDIISNI